jgi:ribosomal protein L37AE/L43A
MTPPPEDRTPDRGARSEPFHCPYCGDVDLRPNETGHGAWECRSCLRIFKLSLLGQLRPPTGAGAAR